MFRPVFLSIVLYFFMKYLAFYMLLMFKNSDFYLLETGSIKTSGDLFYYLWLFLFLPVVCTAIFSVPLYFSFRVHNVIYFFLIVSLILVAEYFVYTYFASQADLVNGLYNALISILFLLLFFFRSIRSLLSLGTS